MGGGVAGLWVSGVDPTQLGLGAVPRFLEREGSPIRFEFWYLFFLPTPSRKKTFQIQNENLSQEFPGTLEQGSRLSPTIFTDPHLAVT